MTPKATGRKCFDTIEKLSPFMCATSLAKLQLEIVSKGKTTRRSQGEGEYNTAERLPQSLKRTMVRSRNK